MKENYLSKVMLLLLSMVLGGVANVAWATPGDLVTIPTTSGTYIDWNNAELTGANVENSGVNIGSTGISTVATFNIQNDTKQDYILTFATGSKNEAKMQVTLTNSTSEAIVLNKEVTVVNTGSWTPTTTNNFLLSQLPTGNYKLTFKVTEASSYAGNWGKLAIYSTDDYNKAPGTIALASGSYSGSIRTENNNGNVGWIKAGDKATYPFICTNGGVYKLNMNISYYNPCQITYTVADVETGATEATATLDVNNTVSGATDILLGGELTTGLKTLQIAFASESTGFLINYQDLSTTRAGDHFAKIDDVTIEGQTVTAGDDTDWYCQLPVSYDAITTFSVNTLYGTATASAEGVEITNNGDGTFTMPTPAMGTTKTITLTLTPDAGTFSGKTTYSFKIFRIGEMSLTSVKVDGTDIDVLTDINKAPYSATYDACYTTAPVVSATQIDGAAATISAPTISGSTYTYTIHAAIDGTEIVRDYTLVLNNVHVYEATGDEEAFNIKNNEGTRENNTWTNGIYTLSTTSLDGYNQYFKMNGNDYTISLPSDVVVKQLIFKECSNNYAGNNARLMSVTSTGATAYIPVDNKFYHESEGAKHDIIVNIEGHTAGTDILFNMPKSGQPMTWIQLTTVKSNPGTAPVKTAEEVNVVKNHVVVTLTFDREIPNDVNATINNTTVTAEGGSAVLVFPIWGLDYSKNYTMTIAAGAVKDAYNNTNAEAINVAVNTEAKPVVAAAAYDYVVSNASELDAALVELKVSNKTADAVRKTVFLKNGNYTYGTLEGAYQHNVSLKIDNWNNIYNVSLIGESKDGVLIEGTTDGITSSTIDLGNGTGIYLQDLTIRNNYDYPKENRFKGVSVAVTGGNKAVLKNVAMQACQDTYVTGKRTYLENCDIYGTVDFICGGGDIFFNQCDLILVDRNGDVIVAPNTTADTKWGYVFQHCTVKAEEGATDVVDKGWDLGRPWQNEPRAYYLNTTMEVLPTDNGWRSMGTLPTHFYEYNSMDKNGNALDLSVRGNSPTSTNHYTPVLTDEEAQKYTVENVLGGTDSWLPTEYTVQVSAPTVSLTDGNLSWTTVDDARCYVVFKNGEYLANVTGTSYAIDDEGIYTVRAANEMGGLGAASTSVAFKRNIAAAKWSTIVLPFDIAASDIETVFGAGASVAELTGGTDTQIIFTTTLTDNKMKANQPYAIKVASAFTAAAISIQPSTLQPSKEAPTQHVANWDFVGTYTNGIIPQDSYFFNSNKLWQATDDTNTIAPFRAYFTYTGGVAARDINFVIDGETTGISRPSSQPLSTTEGSSYYTLDGRKLSGKPTQKGVYIVNGKKLLKK